MLMIRMSKIIIFPPFNPSKMVRISPHVLLRSGGPYILRQSTEGRWPLCLLGQSISYTPSKPPVFELLHYLFCFFSTWGLCIMSSRCLWKAPDSCAAIACNTSLSLKLFGLRPKRKLSSCSVGEIFNNLYQREKNFRNFSILFGIHNLNFI